MISLNVRLAQTENNIYDKIIDYVTTDNLSGRASPSAIHFVTVLLKLGSSIFHRQKLTKIQHVRVLLPIQFHHSYRFQFPVLYFQF